MIFTVLEYPAAFMPAPPTRADQPFTATTNFPTKTRAKVGEVTLTLAHQADFGTITSYTGYAKRSAYLHYDFDATFLSLVHAESDSDQKTFQQTIDVNVTSIEGLDLVVGGSYYHDHLDAPNGVSTGSFVAPSRADIQLRTEAWAGYVDGSLNITDQLVLSAGGRYTHERKKADFTRYNITTGAALVGPFNVGKTFTAFTPRGSLRYEINPRSNVYASISRGFRSGGYNPAGATSLSLFLPFDPETITAYELGFKTASTGFQLEASTFFYDFRDLQVGLTRNIPPFGLVNAVFNAPKAEVFGIDAMITLQPLPELNIRAGGAYLHARYKDFADVSGIGLNSATQTNITNQVQDWSGRQMARAPEFSGNLSVDYTVREVFDGSVTLAGNVQYTSAYVTNNPSLYGPAASPELRDKQRYRQSAYATVNTQISWTDESERFRLTAYVNNLTDKLYRMSYNGNFTGDYATFAQPRTWGIRAGYEF